MSETLKIEDLEIHKAMEMHSNQFYYKDDGSIGLVRFQEVAGLVNIIYVMAGVVLYYCEDEPTDALMGNPHKDGILQLISKYTSVLKDSIKCDIVYACAKFLYDLAGSIVKNGNKQLQLGKYTDYGRKSILIIPDALECYANYMERLHKFSSNKGNKRNWRKYNQKFMEMLESTD